MDGRHTQLGCMRGCSNPEAVSIERPWWVACSLEEALHVFQTAVSHSCLGLPSQVSGCPKTHHFMDSPRISSRECPRIPWTQICQDVLRPSWVGVALNFLPIILFSYATKSSLLFLQCPPIIPFILPIILPLHSRVSLFFVPQNPPAIIIS